MSIQVTKDVLEGIKSVGNCGAANMLDRPRVIEVLEEMGYDQAAVWLSENPELYSRGIFQGFEVGNGSDQGGAI